MTSTSSLIRSTRGAAVVAAGAGLVVGLGALTVPASADVERRGACSDGKARYDMDVDRDDGRFEVSFEVDSNVRGQRWQIALFQDGRRFFRDTRTTDREGEVEVERDRRNTAGTDSFRARAVNLGNGEVCSVRIVRR